MTSTGTYIPCDRLKPYVQSISVQETTEEQEYKVLPGTGLVIGFQYKGRLSYIADGNEKSLSRSGVTGLRSGYRVFKNAAGTGSVLVFFKDGGAAHFFKHPIHELFGESLSLDNFMLRSELLVLEEQLCEAAAAEERINIVEKFLIDRLSAAAPDPMVTAALSLIHKSRGTIRMNVLAEQLHTSQSPLEKRFRKVIGATPKKFASIVRMKSLLEQYKPGSALNELGYDAGFYDQAHFIKEFKNFTGETPDRFLNKK